jgi:malonate transporter|tara:strand:+ start:805 stop:1734 length:930 start_codon:yes stop_codon:yes gene_type:complete
MQTLLDVILPVFLVIGFGYIAVWKFAFPISGIDGMMKFTQSFAIPCLLFQAISKIDLQNSFHPGLLVSFYAGAAICFFVGMVGSRLILKRDWEDCVAIGFCCLFSNSVLLGLPITERAYGAAALTGNFAIVALHSPFCYGLGITVMEITRNRGQSPVIMARAIGRAMFRNALVIAIACGFALNLSGFSLPTVADDALSLVVRAALPVALFSLGGVLIQYKPEGDKLAILMVCMIGLILHPALVWTFGTSLSVPRDFFQSGVLTAAMAPGVNAYIFANMYGRARRVAASSVLIATGSSVITVWLWLTVLG